MKNREDNIRFKYNRIISILIIILFILLIELRADQKNTTGAPSRKVQVVAQIEADAYGAPAPFRSPHGIYVDKENNILYVIASPSGPIYKFDTQNDYKFIEEIGSEAGFSNGLLDLKVNQNGLLYVVDSHKNLIFILNVQGGVKQVIRAKDNRKKRGQLGVIFIDFNKRGDIVLSDKGGQGIQFLDAEGNYLYEIVKARSGDEDFGFPSISQIKINSNDELYVLDNMMCKIIKFNMKGKTLAIFGGRGDVAGKFIDASAITIDHKDRIYVLEQLTGTIQVFDRDGNFLYVLVNEKGKRLSLDAPERIEVDMTGRVYILERMQRRVTVLKFID